MINFCWKAKIAGGELQIQQNMLLGRIVIDRLNELTFKKIEKYAHEDINLILEEVTSAYKCIYGDRLPITNYSQMKDKYIER